MTVKKIYVCDKCGRRFYNEVECLKCENSHSKISKIVKHYYPVGGHVPRKIEVELENGGTALYDLHLSSYRQPEEPEIDN